jgi:hypothetical protein
MLQIIAMLGVLLLQLLLLHICTGMTLAASKHVC